MRDIAEIEHYVASKATAVIATSNIVREDLIREAIDPAKIYVIHNAIEDYWFEQKPEESAEEPAIVFLGRIGGDPFSLKLKGFDRLIYLYRLFPDTEKVTIAMTPNKKIIRWMLENLPRHRLFTNIKKDSIPEKLKPYSGGILLLPSRYEGFSLSLIEGMSQGLVPVAYRVGVVPEIIENGVNGFIVNDENEAENKIKLLLEDRKLRKTMATNAYKTSLEFSADTMTSQMIDVYNGILEHRKKPETAKPVTIMKS